MSVSPCSGGAEGGLYGALGVHHEATAEDLQRAYHQAALRWHPDKTGGLSIDEQAEAAAKFEAAKEAFEVLSDPQRRAIYDEGDGVTSGATRHDAATYLKEVFGDLSALEPFCGRLWLELLFYDEARTSEAKSPDECTAPLAEAGPETLSSANDNSQPSSPHAAANPNREGLGARVVRHLYASASYALVPPSSRGATSGNGTQGSELLLQRQRQRELELATGFAERLLLRAGDEGADRDEELKFRLSAAISEVAGSLRVPGCRLLKAASSGLCATSSWSLLGPRAAHAARAQWSLARAAGAATWSVLAGGAEDAAAEHAAEAVTQLSEADVFCTCFEARAAMLASCAGETMVAAERRLPLLAAGLAAAAAAAEARASSSLSQELSGQSSDSRAAAPNRSRLKLPGGGLYLGAAAHRGGEAGSDLVPHGEGRLFFADGGCHNGLFNDGRADGRGRFFGGSGAQSGCVWEGCWKQNRRVGAFEVWDKQGVLWRERYDDAGKKVARKKVQSSGGEALIGLPEAAVHCTRCGRLFQLRWGSVHCCRHHKDGVAWHASSSVWPCCDAVEPDNPGCEVGRHTAGP